MAYLQNLERLKSDPSNPDLRQQTLELGRTYAATTRKADGTAIFDEVALMNDIGAACAGAAVPRNKTPQLTAIGDTSGSGFRAGRLFQFRIHGADEETGQETIFVIEAETVQQAREIAVMAGYLVSQVDLLTPRGS